MSTRDELASLGRLWIILLRLLLVRGPRLEDLMDGVVYAFP